MERLEAVRRIASPAIQWSVAVFTLAVACGLAACDSGPPPLTAELPIHLEDHLDAATVVGSEVPEDGARRAEWSFDEPQPDWQVVEPRSAQMGPAQVSRTADALRLGLTADNRTVGGRRLLGAIYVALPNLEVEDWVYVEVRARTSDPLLNIGIAFNYTEADPMGGALSLLPLYTRGDYAPLVIDGTVQTYRLRIDRRVARRLDGPWTHLAVWVNSRVDEKAAAVDLLSVRVIPRESEFAEHRVGVGEVKGGGYGGYEPQRRALYLHAPGSIAYQARIPDEGRLDIGLGVLRADTPVTFSISATRPDGSVETLLDEAYSDREHWGQRTVDLSHLAGQTVTLALDAESGRAGTVALWASPTVSGSRTTDKPNVIFYVIDGATAEHLSLYGYNRRTTPNLERLAAEGAVFDRAYSNSTWTRPSTASFMTSLQNSAMGGQRNGFNVVPKEVPTMAQHMHRAGYQTAVMTANPNAGRMSGLERGVDFFREEWEEFLYGQAGNWKESSRYLHEAFWKWRETSPAEPYWVHFQTVDTHRDFPAVAPFSGLFVSPEQLETWEGWNSRVNQAGDDGTYSEVWETTGISRSAFYSVELALWDEAMAYTDYQIGRLVERLKAEGEWENTLLIVGSDHAFSPRTIGAQDSLPPPWGYALFHPTMSRIPLMFVWPGHIEGGQRLGQPVSMIDVLPTILDLVGLPAPEVIQGQSLAPLLLGTGGWEPRPVILDEFVAGRETGELRGMLEVVDGRWGASLEINQGLYAVARLGAGPPEWPPRPVPLLVYDLWNDPYCLHSLHEERPDLVEKYTTFLEEQWAAHQALAQLFTQAETVPLTPEQLEALRSLGYIR